MEKLDVSGRVCPLPLFYTKKKIEKMKKGDMLEVIIDDLTAKETIPKWCSMHGHEVVSMEDAGGGNRYRIVVKKG